MGELYLLADIGGTNARFGLAEGKDLAIKQEKTFKVADFFTIADALHAYLDWTGERPTAACFAVAAPVDGEEIHFTNSNWKFCPEELRRTLGLTRLLAVNDFFALANGIRHLTPDFFIQIKEGPGEPSAPTLVMGPGTGFGQALIVPCRGGSCIVSTESGHAAYAPQSDEEIVVLEFASRQNNRVIVEHLLSGPGLITIYGALCELNGVKNTDLDASEITASALAADNMIAVKALNLFCAILGRVAGDAVLSAGAQARVVLGGGILPRVKEFFIESDFIYYFLDKACRRDYVGVAPVRMIVKEGASLIGAAAVLKDVE